MGFAGRIVGSVFEGEKRFDLVVRLDANKRIDIASLENLYVDIPQGGKIPLSELAEITYQTGAAKISRDDTRRRILVGINVRSRDLQSVVDDIQKIINDNVQLPTGYSITYGGQFENLQSARDRLLIAVPVALILIFILLYFAFKSVREALIIYSAIPLAAVGGILLLWIRDMPFSISAGVGFIALFGIAVLNGIVLIEHYKELKHQGMKHSDELIITGAKDRLRAVLLTASAAALGFLPMAISTNVGAEVQRPLATVVIGGLVSATFLTLMVLPVLYSIFGDNHRHKLKFKKKSKGALLLLFLFTIPGFAQQKELGFEEIKAKALKNNAKLEAASLQAQEAEALINSAYDFSNTEIYYQYDQNNIALNELPLRVFGIQQEFAFPTVYIAGEARNKVQYEMQETLYELARLRLEGKLAGAYYQLQFEREKVKVYTYLDSIYDNFSYSAQRRFELGETNYLEKITAQAKQRELNTRLKQVGEEVNAALEELFRIVQAEENFEVSPIELPKLELLNLNFEDHILLEFYEERISFFEKENDFQRQQLFPDISLNYFTGSNSQMNGSLSGYQVGLKIPLMFKGKSSRIKASGIAMERSIREADENKARLKARYFQLLAMLRKYEEALSYYETEGQELSAEILKTSNLSYQNGEIDFFQYIQSLESANELSLSYLENLNSYNQTVIALNYLILDDEKF